MAHFLLVHGSCHGAWCWRDLVPALSGLGHDVAAIDLPGHGGDPTPPGEITLDLYASRIDDALAALPAPAILVGHSAGGAAISAAAERAAGRIAHLVYLCAYLLGDGETIAGRRRGFARQPLLPAIRVGSDGLTFTVDPALAPGIFYSGCPDEAIAHALPRLCPEPIAPQETPLRLTARSAGLPRSYILCTEDNTIPPEAQEAMAAVLPPGSVIRLHAGHSPFFSHPAELARLLDGIARGTGA
jgi:pimeloyl-ACP methyl ester carboxylesterase